MQGYSEFEENPDPTKLPMVRHTNANGFKSSTTQLPASRPVILSHWRDFLMIYHHIFDNYFTTSKRIKYKS